MGKSEKKTMQRIWRTNVESKALEITGIPKNWEHLGGRGLIARIMVDVVPAMCEPLCPYNKLIFA